MIIKRLEVGPFAANCYIVGDRAGGKGMIIDPGDEADKISGMARKLELDIKHIVLTHGHIDHVGALANVKEATGAAIAVHHDDEATLKDRTLSILLGIPYHTLPAIDRLLEDGDVISVGGLSFTVIHTPGHTPGGICLLGEGVVFTGDTLFQYGIGRGDFPGGSYEQLIKSIKSRLMILEDDIKVYPGHGSETTIGAERRGNPFLI
ncbi:MAG TPA: MBL fold metallo-hydrolase [Dehalococcoidia bacterium]|nr:MBL fold metallo-hydrolase [Dehalococcoidia bacterium]